MSRRHRSRRRAEVPPIRDEEWNFASLSDAELNMCLWWEYLREIPEQIKAVEFLRFVELQKFRPSKRQLARAGFTDSDFEICYRAPVSLDPFPEWPTTPFLLLSKSRRVEILNFAEDPQYDPDSLESGLQHLKWQLRSDIRRLLRIAEFNGMEAANAELEKMEPLPIDICSEEPPVAITLTAFKIDWYRSNRQLKQDFERWLVAQRKEHNRQPNESRGLAGRRRRYRSLLKQLGIFRLLRHIKNDWQQAAEHTQTIVGASLGGDFQHTWQRPADAAEKKIQALRKRLLVSPWLPIDQHLIAGEMMQSTSNI